MVKVMIDIIWPSRVIPFVFRVVLFSVIFIVFIVIFAFRLLFFDYLNFSIVILLYATWVLWAYLFDKTIHFSVGSMEFSEGDVTGQSLRSVFAMIAMIVGLLVVFYF